MVLYYYYLFKIKSSNGSRTCLYVKKPDSGMKLRRFSCGKRGSRKRGIFPQVWRASHEQFIKQFDNRYSCVTCEYLAIMVYPT
jgi:hypothetical protein